MACQEQSRWYQPEAQPSRVPFLGKLAPGYVAPNRRQTKQLRRPQLAMPVSCYYVTLALDRRNGCRSDRSVGGHREMGDARVRRLIEPGLQACAATYGTRKILSVQGSFTLVPGGKPLTSTYLPSLSNGLNTYPGLSGTGLPVGKLA